MRTFRNLACGFLCVVLSGCAGRSFSLAYERMAEIESRAYRMEPNSREAHEWTGKLGDAAVQLDLEVAQLDLTASERKRSLDKLIEENGLILGTWKFERLYEETYKNHEVDKMNHKWLLYRATAKNG